MHAAEKETKGLSGNIHACKHCVAKSMREYMCARVCVCVCVREREREREREFDTPPTNPS